MAENKGYSAVTRFIIASPTKIRPVADVVRRRSCSQAISILENMPQKGARLIKKTLKSAVANALFADDKLDEDMLYIKEIRVDDGPRLKRVWFRARGRADQLLKRMCHISITVAEKAGK